MTIPITPEERYLLDFDTATLPRTHVDILVIGGGIAGLACALRAAEAGASVLLAHKDPARFSNTAWAQGGMAAVQSREDRFEDHVADTLRAGCGLCDRAVVEAVVRAAPEAVDFLARRGARFDRGEDGYSLGREGGHGKRRVLHARGDSTGREFVRTLHATVVAEPGVEIAERHFLIDLLTAERRCVGALLRTAEGGLLAVYARAVVLASGGAGRLYRETSNVRGATGDGIAAAYRAGVTLRDLEFVQFHPTTLYLAGSERILVTEAVRGEGAHLIDDRGRRFLEEHHEDGELAPRDVVSRAIVLHLARADVKGVYLDLRHFAEGLIQSRFPGLIAMCARYGIDPARDPIPVRPAAHYFIGGLATDLDGRTDLANLFACGEAASSGLHGANRLASNSLLEGLVLGTRAGIAAAADPGPQFDGSIIHRTGREDPNSAVDLEDLRKSIVSRMWWRVGILRDADGLEDARSAIGQWRRFSSRLRHFGRAGFELENLLLLGELVTAAAQRREETRGTHARIDHPDRDDRRFLGRFAWRAGEPPRFHALENDSLG